MRGEGNSGHVYFRFVTQREEIEQSLRSRPIPTGFPSSVMLPDYDGLSIVAIPSLIEALLTQSETLSPLQEALSLPSFDRVVFLILDGFGYHAFQRIRAAGDIPTLDRLGSRGTLLPLTTVFPSTTVTALTTLATGLPPIAHGMIGYRLYLRETCAITDMIRLQLVASCTSLSAAEAGLDLDRLLPTSTAYERLDARGVTSHVLLPHAIAQSGLSQVLYRGCPHVEPTMGFADMCVRAREILELSAGRCFLTLYWPGLDAIAHVRGPETAAYRAEAASIDAALAAQLVDRLDDTLLLVSSDHGFVSMRPDDYIELSEFPGIRDRLVRLPVGEPRASYLHVRDGVQPPRQELRSLRDGLLHLQSDRLLSSGLLGNEPPHAEILHRLGGEAIISTGSAGIYHAYPEAPRLRGMHGGLTEEEMLVPFIASAL